LHDTDRHEPCGRSFRLQLLPQGLASSLTTRGYRWWHPCLQSEALHRTPGEPLYDVETWLESNFPRYDWRARGPFYHWAAWLREQGLPEADQRVYAAFDVLMNDDTRRCNYLKQAGWVRAEHVVSRGCVAVIVSEQTSLNKHSSLHNP
jgi:hypothetical protein